MTSVQPTDGVVVDAIVDNTFIAEATIGEAYVDHDQKKFHSYCFGVNKKTCLLAGIIGGVVAVLYILYIHPYYFGDVNKNPISEEFLAGQLQIRQSNDIYYRELRQAVISQLYRGSYDPNIFLRPNSPQRLAMEWMSYQDTPHVPLKETGTSKEGLPFRWIQRFVLMTLFFANNGHTWGLFNATDTTNNNATTMTMTGASWASNFGADECQWELIGCDDEGRLTTLSLGGSSVSLSGSLSKEIGMLTTLRHLDLSVNHLEGSLPNELYDLTHLGTSFPWPL